MSYEIEVFIPNPEPGVEIGFPSGRGAPTFPPNYDRGTNLGPALGHGAELSFASDLMCDPADADSVCDPTVGYDSPGTRVSEL